VVDLKRCEGPGCEVDFEPVRSTARFHSATCRQRAARDRKAAGQSVEVDAAAGKAEHSLIRAVRKELVDAGALDTVDGQLALQIARRIVDPDGTGVSTLSKELRSLLAAAKASRTAEPSPDGDKPGTSAATDPMDEIRKRRDAKARAAAGPA
jgi:hypothetical protein